MIRTVLSTLFLALPVLALVACFADPSLAGGGGGGSVETIKVSKCYCQVGGGQMLIKASSSNVSARLFAYRPDGILQGEVQNGGGSRYGGTVMGYIPYDPGTMTIVSSTGASVTVPTTPFQQ